MSIKSCRNYGGGFKGVHFGGANNEVIAFGDQYWDAPYFGKLP